MPKTPAVHHWHSYGNGCPCPPRRKAARIPPGLLPDTEEEANWRADAADALWREIVRRP